MSHGKRHPECCRISCASRSTTSLPSIDYGERRRFPSSLSSIFSLRSIPYSINFHSPVCFFTKAHPLPIFGLHFWNRIICACKRDEPLSLSCMDRARTYFTSVYLYLPALNILFMFFITLPDLQISFCVVNLPILTDFIRKFLIYRN